MGHIEYIRNTNDLKQKVANYTETGIPEHHLTVITRESIRDYLKTRPNVQEVIVREGQPLTSVFEDHHDNPFKRLSSYNIDEYERELEEGGMLLYIDDSEILDSTDEETLELQRENLVIDKERVNRGEVIVNKEKHTELQEFDVPVDMEEVTVERRPVEGEPLFETYNSTDDKDEGLDVIRIPITKERIKIVKEKVVTEEIIIRKEVVENVEHVSGTVDYDEINITERLNEDNPHNNRRN